MQEKVPSEEKIAFIKEVRQKHHKELVNYLIDLLRRKKVLMNRRLIAEDLVQNVYLNLLRYNLPPVIDTAIAYLKTSALREFLKYMKRRRLEQLWTVELDQRVIEETIDQGRVEPEDVLERASALLSEQEQQIIAMMADEMSAREIARALRISIYVVGKARRMLFKSINDVIHGRVRK